MFRYSASCFVHFVHNIDRNKDSKCSHIVIPSMILYLKCSLFLFSWCLILKWLLILMIIKPSFLVRIGHSGAFVHPVCTHVEQS